MYDGSDDVLYIGVDMRYAIKDSESEYEIASKWMLYCVECMKDGI